jgi:hypothetical protein
VGVGLAQGKVLQIKSVDGMPLSALVEFDAKGPNETEVRWRRLLIPTNGGWRTSDGAF